jgi:hypothetical protein
MWTKIYLMQWYSVVYLQCSPVKENQCSLLVSCLACSLTQKIKEIWFLLNVGRVLPYYMVFNSKRQNSSS